MADYTIYPLTWPSGVPGGFPRDINDNGAIAGDAYAVLVDPEHDSYLTRAFLWDEGGVAILEALDANHSAGANAVNAAGTCVGYSGGRAARWSNGNVVDLHPPLAGFGFTDSVANDINSAGIIVGDGRMGPPGPLTPQSRQVWVREGNQARNLSAELGQNLFWAHAINDQGQITGGMFTAAGQLQAYVYDLATNQLTVLASDAYSVGYDINDAGVVVGEGGAPSAVVSQGDVLVSIGSLEPGKAAIAYGINASGGVVGYSSLSGNPSVTAFLYGGGTMTRLDTLTEPAGWSVDGAFAINAGGWMVGRGTDPANKVHGVVITPAGAVPPYGQPPLKVDVSDIARAVVLILFGISQDGGGVYIGADGKLHHVGPGPGDPPPFWQQLTGVQRDLLIAAAVNRLAGGLEDPAGRRRLEDAAAKVLRDLTPAVAARALSRRQLAQTASPTYGRFDPRRRELAARMPR